MSKRKTSAGKEGENIRVHTTDYLLYYKKIKLLASNMFKWEGFPSSINVNFLEKALYYRGRVGIYNYKGLGLIAVNVIDAGTLNHYEEPTEYLIEGPLFSNKRVGTDDIVIIRNTTDFTPTQFFVKYYAEKLSTLESAKNTNLILSKCPVIIQCDDGQLITLQNIFKQVEQDMPFIYAKKGLNIDDVKPIDLKVPYLVDKYEEQKKEIWRECLDTLGINNANTSKRERLITDEVNSNNQLLEHALNSFLAPRQKACEELKLKYNLDITVEKIQGKEQKKWEDTP